MKIIDIPDLIKSSTEFSDRTHKYYIETYALNTERVHEIARQALSLRAQLIEANTRITTLIDALKQLQSDTTKENA
jgi:hypothetical protein